MKQGKWWRGARRALAAAGAGLMLSAVATAQPAKPISIVVPYAPGGSTDLLGRIVAERLEAALKRNVIVENKPGAGSSVGAQAVARSAPDGRTLLMATSTTLAINPSLYKSLPYQPQRDFAPVGLVAAVPLPPEPGRLAA